MFRFSRLYLIAIVLLATFLLAVLHFAPIMLEQALARHLELQARTHQQSFAQWLQLKAWQQTRWAEEVAANPSVAQLALSLQRGGSGSHQSALDEIRRSTRQVLENAGNQGGLLLELNLESLALVDTEGHILGLSGLSPAAINPLVHSAELQQSLARGAPYLFLADLDRAPYFVAAAPILNPAGEVTGGLLGAERLDDAFLREYLDRLDAVELQAALFREDGHVVASSVPGDSGGADLRLPMENEMVRVVNNAEIPRDTAQLRSFRLEQTPTKALALVTGSLPVGSGQAAGPRLGFMLALVDQASPKSVATLLLSNRNLIQPSRELGLIVGLGVALLVLGLVIFGLEARHYRRSMARLRKQVARLAMAPPESEATPPPQDRVEEVDAEDEPVAESLPNSTQLAEVEVPSPLFNLQPEPDYRAPTTEEAVPSRIMRVVDDAAASADDAPGEEEGVSPVTEQVLPVRVPREQDAIEGAGIAAMEAQFLRVPEETEQVAASGDQPSGEVAVPFADREAAEQPEQVAASDGQPSGEVAVPSADREAAEQPEQPEQMAASGGQPSGEVAVPSADREAAEQTSGEATTPAESAGDETTRDQAAEVEGHELATSLDHLLSQASARRPVPLPPRLELPLPVLSPTSVIPPPPPPALSPIDETAPVADSPGRGPTLTSESAPTLSPEAIKALYEQYLSTRREQGQTTGAMSQDRFREKLHQNEQEVLRIYKCRSVRFEVGVKNGKAVVKAIPVR